VELLLLCLFGALVALAIVVARRRLASSSRPTDDTAAPIHLPPQGAPASAPIWLNRLPGTVAFVDVETTGINSSDRIVTLAGVLLPTAPLVDGKFQLEYVHIICDPGRNNTPAAERLHGYSDWTLQHQEWFSENAEAVDNFLNKADLIVAHHAEFDLDFIGKEFIAIGKARPNKPAYCTMQAHQNSGIGGSASLDQVARRLGLSRGGDRHGALEDAWLVMLIYLAQHGCPYRVPFGAIPNPLPSNLLPAPTMPNGSLPQRKRRPKPRKAMEAIMRGPPNPLKPQLNRLREERRRRQASQPEE